MKYSGDSRIQRVVFVPLAGLSRAVRWAGLVRKSRPPIAGGLALQSHLQQLPLDRHGQRPAPRGVFVWTAETSAACKPAWCYEDLLGAVMSGKLPAGSHPCSCS